MSAPRNGWVFTVFLLIVGPVISAYILYWVIRKAVSGGMRDFERWKRDWDAGSRH